MKRLARISHAEFVYEFISDCNFKFNACAFFLLALVFTLFSHRDMNELMHELLQKVLESISKSEGAWALSLFLGSSTVK